MSSVSNKKRKVHFDAADVDYIASSTTNYLRVMEIVEIFSTSNQHRVLYDREVETIAFTWTIKNFAILSSTEESEFIPSPRFKGGPNIIVDWVLNVSPKRSLKVDENTEDVKDYLSVNVHFIPHPRTSKHYSTLSAKCQFSLLDSEGKPVIQSALPTSFCDYTVLKKMGCGRFAALELLNDPAMGLLVDDTVTIHCRVWIKCDLLHKIDSARNVSGTSSVAIPERSLLRMTELSQDFKKLLETSNFADVSLVTSTKTFSVHKNVLVARSPVFLAMFSSMMLESTLNSVEISDFEADVVRSMLEYMYTGTVSGLEENASELLQISDKYELSGLKNDCEKVLEENLRIENAAEMLTLAHLHNVPRLKSVVISYINRNKESISQTKEFKKLSRTLLVEIFLHCK